MPTLKKNRLGLSLGLIFIGSLVINISLASAADFNVVNTLDDGLGSLRHAIAAANGNMGADTITFDGALNGQTITLATELLVTDDLTIQGPGADQLTVSGGEV